MGHSAKRGSKFLIFLADVSVVNQYGLCIVYWWIVMQSAVRHRQSHNCVLAVQCSIVKLCLVQFTFYFQCIAGCLQCLAALSGEQAKEEDTNRVFKMWFINKLYCCKEFWELWTYFWQSEVKKNNQCIPICPSEKRLK